MSDKDDRVRQVERNFSAFQAKLPELLPDSAGRVAIIHNEEIVQVMDTFVDAVQYGLEKYGSQDEFSVQEISPKTHSLGFYSYAFGGVQQRPIRADA